MTTLIDGPDRWIYPVEVDSASDNVLVEEDQTGDGSYDTNAEISLDHGWYWGHGDSTFAATLPGLYESLESKLNASSLGNTYTITSQTPAGSSVPQSGIRIAGDTYPFSLRVPEAEMAHRLGWADSFNNQISSSGVVDSPYSPPTFFQPWPIFDTKSAAKKDWNEESQIGTSSEDPVNAFQIEHAETVRRRAYTYEWLPAANVRAGKSTNATHAKNAGTPKDDPGHALYHLYETARKKREIVVVHNEGDQGLQVDSHNWERGYLARSNRESFESMLERVRDGGEMYNVDFEHVIVESAMPVK